MGVMALGRRESVHDNDLTADMVPSANSEWSIIERFALTFDGYRQWDRSDQCAEIANCACATYRDAGKLPDSLAELRTCLFFEQRRFRHFGHAPDEQTMGYIRALLEAVRAKVASGRQGRARTDKLGGAYAGSQLQIQIWVNCQRDRLNEKVRQELPTLAELRPTLRWVSPVTEDGFAEYQDAAFLRRVGQEGLARELREFWPKGGPCWDALAVVETSQSDSPNGVLLVEAKSYPGEIYGGGMKATSPRSRQKIHAALQETKNWLGVSAGADWTGPLYQSANRLAHLYFFVEKAKVPAWLLNVCFVDDPHSPTNRSEWETALNKVKEEFGMEDRSVRNAAYLLLEAGKREELLKALPLDEEQ